MERRHSNVMSVFELGRSWEDRSMIAVKVSTDVRINSLADHPVRLLHFLSPSFSSHYELSGYEEFVSGVRVVRLQHVLAPCQTPHFDLTGWRVCVNSVSFLN